MKLADMVGWEVFEEKLGPTFCDESGRPGLPIRLMVGLHYLKYTYSLSDEAVVEGWEENPYWQYFCGAVFFEHRFPIDPSSMTRFRERLKRAGLEELLGETIRTGLRGGFIKKSELKRVNVDTTVQEKEIRFPTDARLYDRCREQLVEAAIERKAIVIDPELKDLLDLTSRLLTQGKHDKNKLYSIHEPDVECISKGKIHKRYEFGCKVGIATTAKENWAVASLAFHGNAYDGHTLKQTLEQVTRVTGTEPLQASCDLGYRCHNYEGDCTVLIVNRYRKSIPASLKRWWKRRSAVEPVIGHMKHEHGMERNRLKGKAGDFVNAMLSACGYNLRKLLRAITRFFYPIVLLAACSPEIADTCASVRKSAFSGSTT